MCGALVCLTMAASSAYAARQTAQLGSVSAALTFTGSYPKYKDMRLTIKRGSAVTYSATVHAQLCGMFCSPGSTGGRSSSVKVIHLEPGAEPNVVLNLFSAGAHCCTIEQVFSYDAATKTYRKAQYDFGDPGATLTDLNHNGRFEFLTADDAFAYEFTDYAGSGMPIEVIRFDHGRFQNVTRDYPGLIAKDAAFWLRIYHRMAPSYQDSVGVIAAWAADEDELGHSALVTRYLNQQLAAGHLNSALDPVQPSGSKFLVRLQRFLRSHGYLR